MGVAGEVRERVPIWQRETPSRVGESSGEITRAESSRVDGSRRGGRSAVAAVTARASQSHNHRPSTAGGDFGGGEVCLISVSN